MTEEVQDAEYTVNIRGVEYHFAVMPENAFFFMIVSAFLNLDDTRIDEVLLNFGVELRDIEGNVIFDKEKGFIGK